MKALVDTVGIGLESWEERHDAEIALTHYGRLVPSIYVSKLDLINGMGKICLPKADESGVIRLEYPLASKVIVGAEFGSERDLEYAEKLERKIRKLGRGTIARLFYRPTLSNAAQDRLRRLSAEVDTNMEESHRLAVLAVRAERLLEESVQNGGAQLQEETTAFLRSTPH